MRWLGSGRKPIIDEEDEKFVAQSIEQKATAHGRRKDSVLYLNHRVKKKDLLKLVNYNHAQRNLAPVKSLTAMYNRSRARNVRSRQAKRHLGRGLFCFKNPPKAEDNKTILKHFCLAQKKNAIRTLCSTEPLSKTVLVRSSDDKAYVCPGTSTGMRSARKQKVLQTEDIPKQFKRYDFPESLVNCTPGTFNLMEKVVQDIDGE